MYLDAIHSSATCCGLCVLNAYWWAEGLSERPLVGRLREGSSLRLLSRRLLEPTGMPIHVLVSWDLVQGALSCHRVDFADFRELVDSFRHEATSNQH